MKSVVLSGKRGVQYERSGANGMLDLDLETQR